MAKIGHASIDERGKATGGNAGDNNGKEVCIRDWYLHSKGWYVLRCKNANKRKKISEAMRKACNNSMIGYDQNQRDSLFNNVKDKGFDPSKTTKKVETDCSGLVRVCIAYAYGYDLVGNIRTITEADVLVKTGEFEKLTSDKYCKSSDYLLEGDILVTRTKGHTVVVLEDGTKVKKEYQKPVASEIPCLKGYKGYSIVDALTSFGYESSFSYRRKLWALIGKKTKYKGTALQNLQLLNHLKNWR